MTEAVVGFVVNKLADVLEKEINLLGGVGKKVERVQRELTRIKCCLQDADSKRKGDAKVQNWLNELRDVAYHIEDATDTFFLEVEDHHQKDDIPKPTKLQKLMKVFNKPWEVPIIHNLGNELDDVQKKLEEIFKSRVDYGIKDMQDKSKGETATLSLRRATYYEVDDNEVVGLQADKNKILKLLHLEKTPRRVVITIVGTGGLGKTTLAQLVYRSAREDFKYHIILSISQHFNLTDLLRKMLLQLKDYVPQNQDIGDLISQLRSFLSSRRYLIILDDVWSIDLWNQLKDVLPDATNGSRVLMTSRFIEVARSADLDMEPYELHFLNDRESIDLLLKKALRGKKLYEDCPSDLLMVVSELSKRCKGLPLALMVVGGILSTKEQSYHVWRQVLQTLNWHSKGKDCMQVLAMSYEDMPYYLKACFLYLASFPENYEICAKRLIRMWAAEGFIPHEGRTTMEEMAENCLEELFQRSLVQVSRRSSNGSIKHFKVHDLLRDLAMHEAREENFVMAFSQESDVKKPNRGIRRASLQSCSPEFMEYIGPTTRSLLFFGLGHLIAAQIPKFSNFRLLKVLELVCVRFLVPESYNVQVRGLEGLVHLKYLGLSACKFRISSWSFHRMKTLETLDIRGTKVEETNALWTISTLRHVLYTGYWLEGPISTANLRNLQTLRWVNPPRTWDRNLPLLNNLRKLGIRNSFDDWVTMTNVLRTLPYLLSLGIVGNAPFPKEIIYPTVLPNYQNLQSLKLYGKWSENVTLEASLFPPHLVKLTLIDSELEQNPMPELGRLKSLKKLSLREHATNYWGPTICAEGFPVLQYLHVDGLNNDLTVATGVMPKLTYLRAPRNIKWHLPPELQHVTVN